MKNIITLAFVALVAVVALVGCEKKAADTTVTVPSTNAPATTNAPAQ